MGNNKNSGVDGAKAPAAPKAGAIDPNATPEVLQTGVEGAQAENSAQGAEQTNPDNGSEVGSSKAPETTNEHPEQGAGTGEQIDPPKNPNEPKPGDPEAKSGKEGETPKTKEEREAEKLVAKYRKAYPANKTFYITSDNQLFLADARNLALLHQRSLKGGEVQTFEV